MEEKQEELYKLKLKALEKKAKGTFQKVNCPSCETAIPSDNINIQDKIAKCGGCHAVFPLDLSFQHKINELLSARKPKQTILRPEGIDLYAYQNELEIAIGQPTSFLDIFPWIFWPIFPIFFTVIFFTDGFPLSILLTTWMLGVFPVLNAINFSKHKIYMTMDDVYFNIQWRPKKFVKDKRFLVRDIDQLYVRSINGMYQVLMVLNQENGQKEIPLMSVRSLAKAKYLEQEIEKYLKIEDREILGEVK